MEASSRQLAISTVFSDVENMLISTNKSLAQTLCKMGETVTMLDSTLHAKIESDKALHEKVSFLQREINDLKRGATAAVSSIRVTSSTEKQRLFFELCARFGVSFRQGIVTYFPLIVRGVTYMVVCAPLLSIIMKKVKGCVSAGMKTDAQLRAVLSKIGGRYQNVPDEAVETAFTLFPVRRYAGSSGVSRTFFFYNHDEFVTNVKDARSSRLLGECSGSWGSWKHTGKCMWNAHTSEQCVQWGAGIPGLRATFSAEFELFMEHCGDSLSEASPPPAKKQKKRRSKASSSDDESDDVAENVDEDELINALANDESSSD